MTKFLTVSGLVFFVGSIMLFVKNYEKFNVERYGKIVAMRVEDLPASCVGTRVPYNVKFSYHGMYYHKMVRGGFCEHHHVGEVMRMKMLEGSTYILFPRESALGSLLSFAVLGVFGLVLAIVQLKKIRR